MSQQQHSAGLATAASAPDLAADQEPCWVRVLPAAAGLWRMILTFR